MKVDLVVTNIGQLVTCASAGGPKRGPAMRDVGLVSGGAIVIRDGRILGASRSADIEAAVEADASIDAGGRVVCPGFVDPHTHIVFAGDRLDEFGLRITGTEYLQILASGGGIISTVRSTRTASLEELVESGLRRLEQMLACGTTSCEIKTGYGLDTETELKMLDAICELDRQHPIDVVPTFLAAHAVPPEFREDVDGYVDLVCDEMLPRAAERLKMRDGPFFVDVFCEKNAFALEQSCRVLEKGRELGFAIKAHVDEFSNLGGSRLAIELGAVSIDHLDAISEDEVHLLAASDTIGIVTPTVNFNLGSTEFADARKLIDAGCAVALSTDFNPGSAPCPSQTMAMAIACRYQKLVPAEVLNAATINAAHSIGLGDVVGSIEVGKKADLLIMDCEDHRLPTYQFGASLVRTVIKNGNIVYEAA